MAQFLASQQISLGKLIVRFLSSRALLCVTAVSIAIACRCLITHPVSWYECLIAVVLLCFWPRIELYVHYLMHHAQGTGLHERHQWHHQHPHDDSALGPVSSMLLYNLIPLPTYFLNMPILATVIVVVLSAITVYEFVHFSTHFRYRPLTAWGANVRKNHLLHHRDPSKYREVVFPKLAAVISKDNE